jgi:hypothetical protein
MARVTPTQRIAELEQVVKQQQQLLDVAASLARLIDSMVRDGTLAEARPPKPELTLVPDRPDTIPSASRRRS